MKQIIDKYDGILELNCTDEIFQVQILMYLS